MAETEVAADLTLPRTPVSSRPDSWPLRPNEQDEPYSPGSLQHTPPPTSPSASVKRKAVPAPGPIQPEVRLHETPMSPVRISPPRPGIREPDYASINGSPTTLPIVDSPPSSRTASTPGKASVRIIESGTQLPFRGLPPGPALRVTEGQPHSRGSSGSYPRIEEEGPDAEDGAIDDVPEQEGLQYHGFDDLTKRRSKQNRTSQMTTQSAASSSSGGDPRASQQLGVPRAASHALGAELRGRTLSPLSASGSDPSSPHSYGRDLSASRRSPLGRPVSYVENLNNVPYSQQIAPTGLLSNQALQLAVGNAASLLHTKKTLDMYRANVKKTTDPAVQYEFAIFMINAAQSVPSSSPDDLNKAELILEAKHILQRLSDRAYPFAQYYLGDGYFSGLFNKDKPDYDKAFPLFVAASKHGHAEAGYRAALCYDFGWGTTKSHPKAVQFYRASASKNHPGAATRLGLACLRGEMGPSRETLREGLKWLKRAQESADPQYNAAPYELGLLHLDGFSDAIFKDEKYAAQLFTQSAELGHAEANFLMGQAYETGRFGCPRDAALSVHFYNGAAIKGHPDAMMALCAWYLVGAEPVLEKDEAEACAWAAQAAETGHPKAQYALGYFTEMGIGCRRDPLEANVWYVRAADQGNVTAQQRLEIIRAAAAGVDASEGTLGVGGKPMSKAEARSKDLVSADANGHGNGHGNGNGGKKKILGMFR